MLGASRGSPALSIARRFLDDARRVRQVTVGLHPSGRFAQTMRILVGRTHRAPFPGTLRAESGADVVKVEDPESGDAARAPGVRVDGTSTFFASIGRNKRCETLDLRRPQGQAVLEQPVTHCDVPIENLRIGTLAAWNLEYARLSRVNPRLVMAHVSGFGQTGPYRDRLAFDRVATAFAGQDFVTGFPDNPPTRPGGALADYVSGLFCTIGVMFALRHRDHVSGRGQEIDLALYEGMLRLSGAVEAFGATGVVPTRQGNTNPNIAPAETFRTRDGQWLAINARGWGSGWSERLSCASGATQDRLPVASSAIERMAPSSSMRSPGPGNRSGRSNGPSGSRAPCPPASAGRS